MTLADVLPLDAAAPAFDNPALAAIAERLVDASAEAPPAF